MRYKVSTETTKSQVVKRIIVGVDMGGSLWATAIHNIETNQDSYYGLKDRDGKRKEDCVVPRWLDRFLDLIGVNVLDCRRAGAEQNPTDHIAP